MQAVGVKMVGPYMRNISPADLWRRLEAEGRLRCAEDCSPYAYGEWPTIYWTLRLTDEEREKLLWDPASRALTEPKDGADCGIAEFTNLDILGES